MCCLWMQASMSSALPNQLQLSATSAHSPQVIGTLGFPILHCLAGTLNTKDCVPYKMVLVGSFF